MSKLKSLYFQSCALLPLSLLKKNLHQPLFLAPIYHCVANVQPVHLNAIMPYGSKHPKQFEKDLDQLLKSFDPIALPDLIHHVAQYHELPSNRFLITFDDGLREVYEIAAPILLRKGIPAVFFVNTSVINNTDLLFRYKASLLISEVKSHPSKAHLVQQFFQELNQPITQDSAAAILSIRHKDRHLLDDLAVKLGVDFKAYLSTVKPFMTTTQLLELQQQGFAIGSHSHTHPEFWNLNIEQQLTEIKQANAWLKQHLTIEQPAFAFPFLDRGVKKSFFDATLKEEKLLSLVFGSGKLKQDIYPEVVNRFDGDNALCDMDVLVKSLIVQQLLNQVKGSSTIQRN